MKRFVVAGSIILGAVSLAEAAPKKTTTLPNDPCAPIGKLADGQLIYSLSCDLTPARVADQSKSGHAEETSRDDNNGIDRTGLLGLSWTSSNPDLPRGPALPASSN
jgi:hypothetical protein